LSDNIGFAGAGQFYRLNNNARASLDPDKVIAACQEKRFHQANRLAAEALAPVNYLVALDTSEVFRYQFHSSIIRLSCLA